MVPVCTGQAEAETWVEDTFEDFADGRLDASGQNLYVARDGTIRTIHRFDLNQDGFIDLIFNSTHDSFALIPASVASVTADREIRQGEIAVEGSQQVELADLNRDGFLDVVFCPNRSGVQHPRRFVTIAWGGEEGWPAYRSNGVLPTRSAEAIAVTDLNHDNWPDVAVLGGEAWMRDQQPGKIIRIFWGSRQGFVLTRRQDIGVVNAIDLAGGDFDGDGAADLAVLTSDKTIHMIWATPPKQELVLFESTEVGLPGDVAKCITAADYDADGETDLVVGTGSGEVVLLPGQSNRSWGEAVRLAAFNASHIAVGDLDADQRPDLVLTQFGITRALGGEAGAADQVGTSVHILWGGGAGFEAARSTGLDVAYASATAVGDLDGDGRQDLAVAVHQGSETYEGKSIIFFGQGNRQFEPGSHTVQTQGATDVAVAPPSGNRPARVVFCNSNGGTLQEKVPLLLYWGGTNGFSPDRLWKVPVNSGYEASGADLNADGFVDLIAINCGHVGEIARADPHLGANIFWGSARGFDPKQRSALREYNRGSSNVADLNRDGYLDVVLGSFEDGEKYASGDEQEVLVIYYGSARGFERSRRRAIPCARRSLSCTIADYNRDEWLDVAATCFESSEIRLFWGSAKGFDAKRKTVLKVPSPVGLETADLNADGYLDLIAGSYHDQIEGHHDVGTFIFWGSTMGFQGWNAQWLPGFTPVGFVVADFDADGFLDLFTPHYHGDMTREAMPCYLYWGSAKGFTTRGRTILICDSGHDGLAADFDRDGRLDLAVSCHARDGNHHTNSKIFYNDRNRFANPRTVSLPTHGTHFMYDQDMGHIYHRRWQQSYESSVHQWDRAVSFGQLTCKADVPDGTKLTFEVRSGSDKVEIAQAEWRALASNRFTMQPSDRCVQYRATFGSDNGDRFPVLDRVNLSLASQP